MKYTQLGRTGLKVSRLVLGTMNFGPQTDEADSHAIMDAALDAGINFFDTANVYGWGENKGRTEEIIGSWFAKGGGRRDKTVLATKVYGNMAADGERLAQPRQALRAQHPPGRRRQPEAAAAPTTSTSTSSTTSTGPTPWEEIWQAIDVLVQQGKILYAGSSNFPGWHIAQANETAARRGSLRPGQRAVPLQPRRAARRDGGHPGRAGVRPRRHPLVAAARRTARRRHPQGARGRRRPAPPGARADALANPAVREQIQAYEDLLRQARPGARRGRPWPGC